MPPRSLLPALLLLALSACAAGVEDNGASPDARDDQARPDASIDAATPDAPDTDTPDAPPPDAFVPPDAPPPDAPPPAETCDNQTDDDGDGDADCDDSDCALACLNLCSPGSQRVVVTGVGLPAPVDDANDPTFDLAVSPTGVVTGAAVRVVITHSFAGDLILRLRSPSGTMIDLANRRGSSGDNYAGTVFADAAATAIADGTPPFAGQFRPDQPLSTMALEPAAGSWQVRVEDAAAGDSGMVQVVQLVVCVCDEASGCVPPVPETACDDGMDNDDDGATDCDDSDCAGFACSVAACPAGTTKEVYAATGLPASIPDPGTTTASVTVPAGLVATAAVQLDITHGYASDVDVRLLAPERAIDLTSDNGGTGDNYAGTILSDDAATPITAGTAPFTGTFRPEQAFALLAGASGGTWTLEVTDDASSDAGTLTGFSLLVCRCEPGTCELGLACGNGDDDDGDGMADCADPDCAATTVCAAEAACTDGLDDDGDGLTDCADPGCALDPMCTPEADCGNGLDDDSDGAADCADFGCDGTAGCTFGRENACSDGIDNDGDGQTDGDEPGCAWAITALPCASGDALYVYGATDLPRAIASSTTLTSTFATAGAGTIVTAAVRFTAAHTFAGDIDLFLVAPNGAEVELTTDNGGSGDNYTQTVFVDAAATAITAGTAPFTGSFRPEQPLSGLAGATFAGTWQARLADDAGGDEGTWTELSLAACVAP